LKNILHKQSKEKLDISPSDSYSAE